MKKMFCVSKLLLVAVILMATSCTNTGGPHGKSKYGKECCDEPCCPAPCEPCCEEPCCPKVCPCPEECPTCPPRCPGDCSDYSQGNKQQKSTAKGFAGYQRAEESGSLAGSE